MTTSYQRLTAYRARIEQGHDVDGKQHLPLRVRKEEAAIKSERSDREVDEKKRKSRQAHKRQRIRKDNAQKSVVDLMHDRVTRARLIGLIRLQHFRSSTANFQQDASRVAHDKQTQ